MRRLIFSSSVQIIRAIKDKTCKICGAFIVLSGLKVSFILNFTHLISVTKLLSEQTSKRSKKKVIDHYNFLDYLSLILDKCRTCVRFQFWQLWKIGYALPTITEHRSVKFNCLNCGVRERHREWKAEGQSIHVLASLSSVQGRNSWRWKRLVYNSKTITNIIYPINRTTELISGPQM
jgi:hypothetical protein